MLSSLLTYDDNECIMVVWDGDGGGVSFGAL